MTTPDIKPKSVAADGVTRIYSPPVAGWPLLVAAVDFNRVYGEIERLRTQAAPAGYVTAIEEGKVLMLPRASLNTAGLVAVYTAAPAQQAAPAVCSDERPCLPCYLDQGACEAAPAQPSDQHSCHDGCSRPGCVDARAQQAEPTTTGDVWLKHDDDLRFVARVLESPCPKEDIDAARAIVHGLRTTARAHAQQAEPVAVECWHGERKVTIYPGENVLRVWGADVDDEMSEEPFSLKAVQDAMDWLYEAQPSAQGMGLADAEIERIAVKHEAFGFGQVQPKGITVHGFEPEGLRAFVDELRAALAQAPASEPLTGATRDVLAERQRQISAEGYSLQHDADMHDSNDLARAAAFYALAEVGHEHGRVSWPWDEEVCKVKDRYRNFVRGAALLMAAADVELARGAKR